MHHLPIDPNQVEALKQQLQDEGWQLIHQDAGQNHFVGWGYIMQWQKAEALIWLHYSDKQGKAEARLELNDFAKKAIELEDKTLNS